MKVVDVDNKVLKAEIDWEFLTEMGDELVVPVDCFYIETPEDKTSEPKESRTRMMTLVFDKKELFRVMASCVTKAEKSEAVH